MTEIIETMIPYLLDYGAIVLLLVVSWVALRVGVKILEQALRRMELDQKIANLFKMEEFDKHNLDIAGILSQAVYYIGILFILTGFFESLGLDIVTEPVNNLVVQIVEYLPRIIIASLMLGITYKIGKELISLVAGTLNKIGFDDIVNDVLMLDKDTDRQPSKIMGNILFVYILLLTSVQALEIVNLRFLTDAVEAVTRYSTQVGTGVVIMFVGLYLSNVIKKVVMTSTGNENYARYVRVLVIFITLSMALNEANLATDIVNLAFMCIFAAGAVAFAIAFGLGGRDVAKKVLEDIYKSTK